MTDNALAFQCNMKSNYKVLMKPNFKCDFKKTKLNKEYATDTDQ